MVRYSPRAAQALAFLKRPYNDIDIFVEDTANHNMWLLLLRRILPPKIKLSSVNLLGGRERVEEACKLDQADTGRKKLYITDGDFDFLNGRNKPRLKNLYRLRAYCIENLLLHESAVIQTVLPLQPAMTEREIHQLLDYENWQQEVQEVLAPLFIVYATVNRLMPHVRTTAHPVVSLVKGTAEGQKLCRTKVIKRTRHLLGTLRSKFSREQVRNELRNTRLNAARINYNQGLSGKDYILPLLWLRIKCLFSYRGTLEQLKVLLAQFWHNGREAVFARRLLRLAA